MLKKCLVFLLSLLMSLSIISGQAQATEAPESSTPPAVVEPLDPDSLSGQEPPDEVDPLSHDPDKGEAGNPTD